MPKYPNVINYDPKEKKSKRKLQIGVIALCFLYDFWFDDSFRFSHSRHW